MLSESDRAFLLNVAQLKNQGHRKARAAIDEEVDRIYAFAKERDRVARTESANTSFAKTFFPRAVFFPRSRVKKNAKGRKPNRAKAKKGGK